jgi:chromate transport protein ChrA
MKYLLIHIITGLISALVVLGIYYEYLNSFTSSELSSFILLRSATFVPESVSTDVKLTKENHKYKFGYSYFLITILAHAILGFGLSILTNTVNSLNVKKRVLQKGLLMFMINVTFGIIIGPIGYTWPSLALYIMMIIIRNDFDQLNTSIVITYMITLTTIIIVYPLIAIKIKYFWHSKYRNYIEYYL